VNKDIYKSIISGAFKMDQFGELNRTCYCNDIKDKNIGDRVTVMGWVDRVRDLGNLTFVDIRDRTGLVQVVISSEGENSLHTRIKKLRSEYVVSVSGPLIERDAETFNPSLPTGKVEVLIEDIKILNTSLTPPFPIESDINTSEETRLKYRYLDLRRSNLQKNLEIRHRVTMEIRKELDEQNFLEIETPILNKSTPEGARDYLVPSRVQRGAFYALPQSPQLFKQLLMVSGFDRYFQIARCFRDEDLRADRQPEFTQVDIEMSFVQPDQIFGLIEKLLQRVFRLVGQEIETPFPRFSYEEVMNRFGTDRPDTRFGLELRDVSRCFKNTPFQVFREIIEDGGMIKGINTPEGESYSRKELDDLISFVRQYGASGLVWIKSTENGIKSSLPKIVPEEELAEAINDAGLETGQTLLLVAGKPKIVHESLSALRLHLANKHSLISPEKNNFLWVLDFPLLDWDEEAKRWVATHHPFTSPRDEDIELLASDPGKIKAKAYDVVLNGLEIGGGSIRIHRNNIQKKVFKALGIEAEEAENRFGFLLKALRYGAPPHGGIALGLDRLIMMLLGEKSIREVIAFPKTARALDLMCEAPSAVDEKQLRELHIKIRE
jgi:aspartyl-tRNA synthetase